MLPRAKIPVKVNYYSDVLENIRINILAKIKTALM